MEVITRPLMPLPSASSSLRPWTLDSLHVRSSSAGRGRHSSPNRFTRVDNSGVDVSYGTSIDAFNPRAPIDYRCEDRKKVGELSGYIGAIR